MRDLERIVLSALKSQQSSRAATTVAIEPVSNAGDWLLGPIGFCGDVPPQGYAELVRALQEEYELDQTHRPLSQGGPTEL
jgi:hypothetical protein